MEGNKEIKRGNLRENDFIYQCSYCGVNYKGRDHICEATHLPTLANKVRLLEERLRKLEAKR